MVPPGPYELWYTRRGELIRGPFPASLVSGYLLLGRLLLSDEVSQDRASWVVLAEVSHLIPQVMHDVLTDADREELRLARLCADERLADRRTGRRLMSPVRNQRRAERRRSGPAAAPAPQASEPAMPRSWLARLRALRSPRLLATLALALVGVIGAAAWSGADLSTGTAEGCRAAPGPGVDWSHCDRAASALAAARLQGAILTSARLTGSDLRHANLAGADLNLAELSGAQLQGAVLAHADLRGASLVRSNLAGADLRDADLRDAKLDGARLDSAVWVDGRVCAPGSRTVCR